VSGFRFAILAAIFCAAALAHVREAAAQSAGNGADVLPPQLVVQSGHANRVLAVAIAPDETIVATGAEDRQIRLWDLRSGKEFRTLSGHERPVSALTFDASGAPVQPDLREATGFTAGGDLYYRELASPSAAGSRDCIKLSIRLVTAWTAPFLSF